MTKRRCAIAAALAAAIAVVVPAAVAPAVSQAAAYRYWTYWLGSDSGWSFASVGPAFRLPADGTLEGWRYSVSGVEGNRAPSIAADFDAICGDTLPVDGRKRVAVVVDPGLPADAPAGEQPPGAWAMCVLAEERATGYAVLRAAASVRAERGLICAIGGYPARGCADVVAEPTPSTKPTPTTQPTPTPKPTPKPTPGPTTSPTPQTSAPAPSTAPASASSTSPTRSREGAAPSPIPSTAPSPTRSQTPSTMVAPPSPEPSYSLLTAPLEGPPADGGSGGALVAGIAVVGIAGLGGAAILRMRRAS